MNTLMILNRAVANRMTDEQRKAVFAKLKGGMAEDEAKLKQYGVWGGTVAPAAAATGAVVPLLKAIPSTKGMIRQQLSGTLTALRQQTRGAASGPDPAATRPGVGSRQAVPPAARRHPPGSPAVRPHHPARLRPAPEGADPTLPAAGVRVRGVRATERRPAHRHPAHPRQGHCPARETAGQPPAPDQRSQRATPPRLLGAYAGQRRRQPHHHLQPHRRTVHRAQPPHPGPRAGSAQPDPAGARDTATGRSRSDRPRPARRRPAGPGHA
jgi:hypothetical protein